MWLPARDTGWKGTRQDPAASSMGKIKLKTKKNDQKGEKKNSYGRHTMCYLQGKALTKLKINNFKLLYDKRKKITTHKVKMGKYLPHIGQRTNFLINMSCFQTR